MGSLSLFLSLSLEPKGGFVRSNEDCANCGFISFFYRNMSLANRHDMWEMRLGAHDRDTDDVHVQRVGVRSIVQHGSYDDSTLRNDIAIMFLSSQPIVTDEVSPVCVSNANYHTGEMCAVTGWGTTSEGECYFVKSSINAPVTLQ